MIKKFLIKLRLPKSTIIIEKPEEVVYYSEGKKCIIFETKSGLRKRIRKEDVKEKNVIFIDAESPEEAKEIYENTELNNIKDDIEKLKNNIFKYSAKNELDVIYIIKSTWSQFYIKFNYTTKFLEDTILKDGFKNLKIHFRNTFSDSTKSDAILFVADSIQFFFSNKFIEDVNNIFESFLNEIKERLYVDTKLNCSDFAYIKTRNLRDARIERCTNITYCYNELFTKFSYIYYDNDRNENSFIVYFDSSSSSYSSYLSILDDENSEENIKPFLDIQENIRKQFDYHPDEKINLIITSIISLYDYATSVVKDGIVFKMKDNNYYSYDNRNASIPSLESVGLAKLNSKFRLAYQQYKIEGDPKYIISHIKNNNGLIQILDGQGWPVFRASSKTFEKRLFEELERNKDEIGEDNYNFYLSLYLLKYSTFDVRDDVNESKIKI